MSWPLKEKLQVLLRSEIGTKIFAPGSRTGFALGFPNTYHVGMSNLGLHIMYRQINERADTACERFFLPDKNTEQEYIRTNTPLMTLETQRSLYEFPLVGFSVSFELDYFNVLKMLDMGKIPIRAVDRGENDPIVIIGGPCATFNPEPLALFADVFVIGEGEEVIQEFLDIYYREIGKGAGRREILRCLADVDGLYIPLFYQPQYNESGEFSSMEFQDNVPEIICRRWVKDLSQYSGHMAVITENTEFKDMFLIEVARGCGRHCRFCMAGYCFRKPRSRNLLSILEAVDEAKAVRNKVGLVGAAISDYPEINALCEEILRKGMTLSVASLRADSLTDPLVQALVKSKHKTMTIAPEAATDKMRRVINKTLTMADLNRAITMAISAGIPHIRLYIMVGLPFEEDDDVEAIVAMANDLKRHMEACGSKGMLTLSVNPFIPKPFTPFQWMPMANMETVEKRIKYIQAALKKIRGIEVIAEPVREAYLQAVLARADRRIGEVLLTAYRAGGAKSFRQAMKIHGLKEDFYLYRQRDHQSEVMPWEHLDMGVDKEYFVAELHNAEQGIMTGPCTASGCRRCGVCKADE